MRQIISIVSLTLILALAAAAVCSPKPIRSDGTVPTISHRGQPVLRRKQGAGELSSHDTARNILINSDLEANVPLIEASIEKLGFKFKDTRFF